MTSMCTYDGVVRLGCHGEVVECYITHMQRMVNMLVHSN